MAISSVTFMPHGLLANSELVEFSFLRNEFIWNKVILVVLLLGEHFTLLILIR